MGGLFVRRSTPFALSALADPPLSRGVVVGARRDISGRFRGIVSHVSPSFCVFSFTTL